jgi:hypothetical protein
MDIADKFQEIGIFLAENGLITVLKQMTVTSMPSVESNRMARQEPPHYRSYRCRSCTKEEMKMVGDQGPGITACPSLFKNTSQPIQESIAIMVISKYVSLFYASDNNVMKRSRSVYARLTGHKPCIFFCEGEVNL